MAERLTWDNVIDELLARVPELRPVYQQQLDALGPPIGQYELIYHAARFAEGLAARAPGDPAAEDTLRRLAAVLEEMATSDDPYLTDLMGAGFVEAMRPAAPGFDYLVELLGPASRAYLPSWFFGSGPD